MYSLAKKILFQFPAETAHHLSTQSLKYSQAIPGLSHLIKQAYAFDHIELQRQVFGLTFKNPVGLAAGFDKDGKYLSEMSKLGFGFLEVGTVTPKPQKGNPKPRLFRLPKDQAIINRMGFNNDGVDALVTRLKKLKNKDFILGGNIGKNKWTPNEEAYLDYLSCFEKLFPFVDYFVVNVSSPNTPDLRQLQEKEPLTQLLNILQETNHQKSSSKPILLKIAPDLNQDQLRDILTIVRDCKIAGIIATNTTIERAGLHSNSKTIHSMGAGGLSGQPLGRRSTEIIRYIHKESEGKIPVIGVGGIMNPKDALEKIEAGACLIQLYSGLIYSGPSLVKHIKQQLVKQENLKF